MKAVLDRRFEEVRAEERTQKNADWIKNREQNLNAVLLKQKKELEERQNLAASRIEALARGKLSRIEAAELRDMHRAAGIFQKGTRGAQGRKKAREARWKLLRVVSSERVRLFEHPQGPPGTLRTPAGATTGRIASEVSASRSVVSISFLLHFCRLILAARQFSVPLSVS